MATSPPRIPNVSSNILQNYNNELSKCVEDLCSKRDELNRQLEADNAEKIRLHNDMRILSDRLAKVNTDIAQRMSSRMEYDRAIVETEAAYTRLMTTSQTLLHSTHTAEVKIKAAIDVGNDALGKLPKVTQKRDLMGKH